MQPTELKEVRFMRVIQALGRADDVFRTGPLRIWAIGRCVLLDNGSKQTLVPMAQVMSMTPMVTVKVK